MLQVTQHQKTGELRVEELPTPRLIPGTLLVANQASVISTGTERTSVQTARASLVGKARSRPDLVSQVIENARREGIVSTIRKVQNRLDNIKELGYSSAGIVLESSVTGVAAGDPVACAGTAYHAEVVRVSRHLATPIPAGVDFEEGAFVALGAIALQGVRQAEVRIGENVAVVGLGLVGLLAVQLLKAQGCRVIGLDVDPETFELARRLGCDDCAPSDRGSLDAVESFSRGYGADAVVITASTLSNEPLELALHMARPRARVVVVGAVGMDVPRSPFYEKELELTISRSYGPGRYDVAYEDRGVDYPLEYVRWTENRNMEAVLDLIAAGSLDVRSLITHRYPVERAVEAYDLITGKDGERSVAVVLHYPERAAARPKPIVRTTDVARADTVSAGFVGAGNFAQSHLLPHLLKAKIPLRGVATSSAVSAQSVATKFGFAFATTTPVDVLTDDETNAIFIATRHDSHARYVAEALDAGHHVFVEKPLAITSAGLAELEPVVRAASERGQYLAVGFNRRFSAQFEAMAEFFSGRREPLLVTYRVNAGRLPRDAWIRAADQGGRIVGEACHFVDFCSALVGAAPVRVYASATRSLNIQVVGEDSASIIVDYADGSVATVVYVANGDAQLEKEYCEASAEGRTAALHDFKKIRFYRDRRRSSRSFDGRKGHAEEVKRFIDVLRGEAAPVFTFDQLAETSMVTFGALDSVRDRVAVDIAPP